MPTYDYACSNRLCDHRERLIFGIFEYDAMTLKDKPCQHPDGRRKPCDGTYEHTFETGGPAHSFKGEGWTPKFHHAANQGGKG